MSTENHKLYPQFPDRRAEVNNIEVQIKIILFRMLQIFDNICQKYAIDYWLDYNTLLGASCYQEFLPKETEASIGMLRVDYDLFIEKGMDDLPFDMFFQNADTDPRFCAWSHTSEACLRDRYSNKLSKAKKYETINWHNGLQVSIFVYDIDDVFIESITNRYERVFGNEKKYIRFEEIEYLDSISFEGYKFPVPIGYDSYLKRCYGDSYKHTSHNIANRSNTVEIFIPCNHSESLLWGIPYNNEMAKINRPLVSVVMPVYNSEEFVGEAIESILNQTYQNLELIIVNDGSTDNSVNIIQSYTDSRIIFINNKKNAGNYVCRNIGCKRAKGKYICVMDADDIAVDIRIDRQVAVLESDNELLAVGSLFKFNNKLIASKPLDYESIKISLLHNNSFLHPSLMIKKAAMVAVGYYDESYYYSSDYDLVCKLSLLGKIINLPDVLMMYRIHPGQISQAGHNRQTHYANKIRLSYLRKCGFILSEKDKNVFTSLMSDEFCEAQQDIKLLVDFLLKANSKKAIFHHRLFEPFLALKLYNKEAYCIKEDVTVILTVWKRNHLDEQLNVLFSQTKQPDVIWVQQTMNHVDVSDTISKYGDRINYFYYENNHGVYGRFHSVINVNTKYCLIIDDDMIPGFEFIERALSACKRHNAIISPHGRIITPETNHINEYVGDGYEFQHSFCLRDTKVDFGNNAWFFKTEWIKYFLRLKPTVFNNGEDIHLSASCSIFANIKTYIPEQIMPSESGNVQRVYSSDKVALHNLPQFQQERIAVIDRFRKLGWQLSLELEVPEEERNNKPLVSIILPVLNNEISLNKSLYSLINQSFSNFELIVIDRNSSDNSIKETEKLKDNRIHFISSKKDLKLYTALNIGMGIAQGRYIFIADSLMVYKENALICQIQIMENDEHIIASGNIYRHDKASIDHYVPHKDVLDLIEKEEGGFILSTMVLRSDILKRIKYISELHTNPEYNFIMKLASQGKVVGNNHRMY